MAFEVFDDVAFYWFLQVILGITLIPITIYKIYKWCTKKVKHKTRSHPIVKSIPDYIPHTKLVEDEEKINIDRTFSLSNIFFMIAWILFLLLLIQLPKWHNRQMTNFDPLDILQVSKGSTEQQIKRAYRKMSLKYHPDKCSKEPLKWPLEKCKDMFIMVRKAYETLTDETTKENYEKYGNPDGYKGTMVTIGLPSWLTHKENELVILSFYFTALVILVGIVYTWWSHSSQFHKSGVYKQSIDIYWRFIKHNMGHRYLLDILAASSEFRILDIKIPSNDPSHPKTKAMQMLQDKIISIARKKGANVESQTNSSKLNNLFEASYVTKTSALLHCHLMGMKVPSELKEEYLFVLQEVPRLLDVMIDMTVSRERFLIQGLHLIQLKQAVIQGVWWVESQLKQLPHWTPAIDRGLRELRYDSLIKLNFLDPNDLEETLTKAYSKYSEEHSHLVVSALNDDKEKEKNSFLGGPDMNANTNTSSSSSYHSKKKNKKSWGGNKRRKNKNTKNYRNKHQNRDHHREKDNNNNNNNNNNMNGVNNNNANKDTQNGPITSNTKTANNAEGENTTENDTENEVDNNSTVSNTPKNESNEKKDKSSKEDDILPPGTLATEEEVVGMVRDAQACVRMYPFVKMDWCARTYEEKEIYNGDIVKVSVHLERVKEPWNFDMKTFQIIRQIEPPEFNKLNLREEGKQQSNVSTEYDDEHGLDFVDNELEDARRLQIARLNAPVVHVTKFPFRVREKWMVMLVDQSIPAVIDQRAIPDLSGLKKIDLHFRAQKPPGKHRFSLVVKCDSYLGADKVVHFELLITDPPEIKKKRFKERHRNRDGRNNPNYESDEDENKYDFGLPKTEDDKSDPKWYYLWNETFWEFLLTLFLLYFIYLVIMSSSWGKKYLQTYVDLFSEYCVYPVSNVVNKYLNDFVLSPITNNMLKHFGIDLVKWWYGIEDDFKGTGDSEEEKQGYYDRAQADFESGMFDEDIDD